MSNDSAAFSAFAADYQNVTDPITLHLEPGSYVQGTNWMRGIDRLLVQGGPATFADNRRVGANNWQRQSAQYSLRLEAVSAGDTLLTVKDVDPARLPASLGEPSGNPNRSLAELMALVTPGDWVLLSAWDTMGYGFPTNPQVFEYAEVASVGVDTITLTSPTRFAYSDTYPVYWNGAALQSATNLSGVSGTFIAGETVIASSGATGLIVHTYPSSFQGASSGIRFTYASLAGKTVSAGATLTGATSGATATVVATGPGGLGGYRNLEADQGGPATLYVLHPDWDTEVTLRNLTWPTSSSGQVSMAGRLLTFESVDFSGMTAASNNIWPSASKSLTFTNCQMNTPEHDKLVQTLTIQGGTATTHIVQSASIDTMVVEDHTCTGINGTPRNIEIRNTTAFGTVRLGPLAYGVAESAAIENSSAGKLAASLRTVSLTGVTFSEGVFSKSDPNDQGVAVFGREWAFPGTKIALANSSGQVLAIAEIMAFSETAGTASVTTTLPELPAGADRIYPHPCWNVTASGNTGALAVLNGSVNQPLFSHANLTAPGTMTLWGNLTELRVNVTGTYAGNLTISGSADSGTWTATINLSMAGARVISASGATGAQTGDTLPAAEWFRGAFTVAAGGGAFSITATTAQVEAEKVVASRTIGYYPMDETSGNFVNAVFPDAYLKRNGTVTQQVEGSGLVLARTVNDTVDAIIGNSADGIVLTGDQPWCIHGFFRWRNDFNGNRTIRGGGNPSPWGGGPVFAQLNAGGAGALQLTTYDGIDATTAYNTILSPGAGNELRYVAFGWEGTNAFLKLTTDGTTWTSATTPMSTAQMEGPPIKFEIGDYGAEIDVGQVRITRDIPSEADLTWFANGMVGRATADVLGRIGTWPALQELPATVQTDGGTTWSGTTNTSLTGFITSADTGTSTYWTRPYYLRGMDAALADTHGDYVWLNSSDHQVGDISGISIGFSSSPSDKPASWSRIWAPGATGEPGQYDANFTNALGSAETPWLVYNPDDADGRPFWIYYHDMARDSRTSDGSTGYSTPQETWPAP